MDVFEINEINGIVTLKQKIDYEIIESYALTVAANDSALPLSAQLLVIIIYSETSIYKLTQLRQA